MLFIKIIPNFKNEQNNPLCDISGKRLGNTQKYKDSLFLCPVMQRGVFPGRSTGLEHFTFIEE